MSLVVMVVAVIVELQQAYPSVAVNVILRRATFWRLAIALLKE